MNKPKLFMVRLVY